MNVNQMLRIDQLEKQQARDAKEIAESMATYEKEYHQYRGDVSESWSPHIFQEIIAICLFRAR